MTSATPIWDPLLPLEPGITLLEASAGTGKTYTITGLMLRLIAEQGVGIEQILVVTYTRAATAELGDRIRARLIEGLRAIEPDAERSSDAVIRHLQQRAVDPTTRREMRRRLAEAVERFDQATISTIHGFCQRMLQQHAFESRADLDVTLVPDMGDQLQTVAEDVYVNLVYEASSVQIDRLAQAQLDLPGVVALARAAVADPEMAIFPAAPPAQTAVEVARQLFHDLDALAEDLLARLEQAKGTVLKPTQRTFTPKSGAEMVAQVREWLEAVVSGASDEPMPGVVARWIDPSQWHKQLLDPAAPFQAPLLSRLEAYHAALLSEAGWRRAELAHEVRRRFEEVKQHERAMVFQDLLRGLAARLGPQAEPASAARLAKAIGSSYRVALIDEFQDTDAHQWTIFERSFGSRAHQLYLIGDPKQAIYGFRGANVHVYAQAARVAQRRFTMDTNWRTEAGLLDVMNAWLGGRRGVFGGVPFDYQEVRAPSGGARRRLVPSGHLSPVQVRWLTSDEDKPVPKAKATDRVVAQLARDVVALLEGGHLVARGEGPARPVGPGDLAVLVRTGHQARQVQDALSASNVPSVMSGALSVMASEEAELFEWWLDALADPGGRLSRVVASSPWFGWTADDLLALADGDAEVSRRWDAWVARLTRWRALLGEQGVHHALRAALHEERVLQRLLTLPDGPRRVTNLLHVAELVHTATVDHRLGLEGARRWLSHRRVSEDLDQEVQEMRLDRDDDAVQIMTIHKSKGLEFGFCFVPFLWDVRASSGKAGVVVVGSQADPAVRELDVGVNADDPQTASRLDRASREVAQEEVRLLYVALTRAVHQVTVYAGDISLSDRSAFAWTLAGGEGAGGEPGASIPPLEVEQALRSLSDRTQGALSVEEMGPEEASLWNPTSPVLDEPPAARRMTRRSWERFWGRHSYSSLIRLASHGVHEPDDEGVDRDDPDAADPAWADAAPAEPLGTSTEVPLGTFPGGTDAGITLHDVMEHLDFPLADDEAHARPVVAQALRRGGFDVEAWVDPVLEGVRRVVSTPLGGPLGSLSLGDIPRDQRLDELRFDLPVAGGRHRLDEAGRVTDQLLDALAMRSEEGVFPTGWLDSLSRMSGRHVAGYLNGFIDLVFMAPSGPQAGRWWVADHKSNKLGRSVVAEAFHPEALRAEMASHHYYFQYHLYLLALHRFLRARVPGYHYDQHVGGAVYLFLRGMVGPHTRQHPEGTYGVFWDRPPIEVIDAMDRALGPWGGLP